MEDSTRKAAARCEVMAEPWYLLYGGTSADGLGWGVYEGRTLDYATAKKHFIKVSKDPYSTGSVTIVTDTKVWMARAEDFA